MKRFLQHFSVYLVFSACQAVHADNWRPLTGSANPEAPVAGATAEIRPQPGVTALGRYHPDGTAEIRAWNEIFRCTWRVEGDDQVCCTSEEDQTNCFTFAQNLGEPSQYRSRNVASGEVIEFRRIEGEPGTFERAAAADDAGGAGSPSAAEIAVALSDPNTAPGTMNFQCDYVAYQGDIPGAGSADAQRMLFQPSLSYLLSDTKNVFVRPAIPVIFNQDVPGPRGGFNSEGVDLGDISFEASLGRSLPDGVVLLGGLTGTLPTAPIDVSASGGSDNFYDMSVNVGYQWTDAISTSLGYRILDVDYNHNSFVYDVKQEGWGPGLSWVI